MTATALPDVAVREPARRTLGACLATAHERREGAMAARAGIIRRIASFCM